MKNNRDKIVVFSILTNHFTLSVVIVQYFDTYDMTWTAYIKLDMQFISVPECNRDLEFCLPVEK